MTNRDAANKVSMAINTAVTRWKEMGSIIVSMVPVEQPNLTQLAGGPLAVDKRWRLYYDPEWIMEGDNGDPRKLSAVVIHEAIHILYRHHQRYALIVPGGGSEWHRRCSNIAMDCVIWETAVESGISGDMPDFHCKPEMFGLEPGKAWESWFRKLLEREDEDGEDGSPGRAFSGSCSDGQRREWEQSLECGEGEDEAGISEGEAEHIVRKAFDKISESPGRMVGRMKLEVEEFLTPRIDPERLFVSKVQSAVREAGRGHGDWTYRRPSRRQNGGELIRPSMLRKSPKVCVVIDTSGSMMGDDIKLAIGFLRKALNSVDDVRLVAGDVELSLDQHVRNPNQIPALVGGGGTDMANVLGKVCEDRRASDVVVCVTDGITGWPSVEQVNGMRVVVALTRKADVPEWLDAVLIGEEG